jgi:hypothetical protein
MRKICNNNWEPRNKLLTNMWDRATKKEKRKDEALQYVTFSTPNWDGGFVTQPLVTLKNPDGSTSTMNLDGSVSVSLTPEEQALGQYWNASSQLKIDELYAQSNRTQWANFAIDPSGYTAKINFTDQNGSIISSYDIPVTNGIAGIPMPTGGLILGYTTNGMMMASGGLVDDGNIIGGPGNDITGYTIGRMSPPMPIGGMMNVPIITTDTDPVSTFTWPNPEPKTDTELIRGLMDRLRMMEAAVIDLSARLRGLNAELAQVGRFIVNKQMDSDTKWFLNPETAEQEEPKPGRKFRPIEQNQLEA